MNTFAYGFAGIGEPFIGFMVDTTGQDDIVFAVTAVVCFISAFIILFIKR